VSFQPGVIEGFYGPTWSWAQRRALLDWMPGAGFGSYVYAPKADAGLRRTWRQGLDAATTAELWQLRLQARRHGLEFGLGLSPWGLQQGMTAADARALRAAVDRLNRLEPDLLCILFDDMPGGQRELAARQRAVVEEVLARSQATRHAICPTYYSRDPVLEELFGPRPPGYLEALTDGLPAATALLWTGRKVVSERYEAEDFHWLAERGVRSVLLWDNSAVNDGRRTSGFLPLTAWRTPPSLIAEHCTGHLVNPVNQPALARQLLSVLGAWYRHPERPVEAGRDGLLASCAPALAELLSQDAECFEHQGLERLTAARRQQLAARYAAIGDPVAEDIAAWLRGEYAFDPNCLND